jgi:hypothetical protein
MAASGSNDHFIKADLTYRPPSAAFKSKPPARMLNQIYWIRQNYTTSVTTSATALTEINTSFTAVTNMQQYGSYLAVFDQYCLHSVVYTVANTSVGTGVNTNPTVYTAIDFDNTSNLGSAGAIQAYGTCNTAVLASGESVTRYFEPCTAGYVYTNVSGNYAVAQRTWIDSASTGISFYGIRTLIPATSSGATILSLTFACVWALRNNI